MEVSAGLVAGSHYRNEIVVIRRDGEFSVSCLLDQVISIVLVAVLGMQLRLIMLSYCHQAPLQQLSSQICKICDDEVGFTIDGEPFVACNDCAFPVCRTCYDYERREGSQVCPQCKTRFKRLKGNDRSFIFCEMFSYLVTPIFLIRELFIGCPRVHGDEEEDDIDDVENEFNFESDHMKHDFQCYGFEHFELDMPSHESRNQLSQVPLLTGGQMVKTLLPHSQIILKTNPYALSSQYTYEQD